MNVYYRIRETTTPNIEKAQYIKCHISKYLSNLKKKKVRELGMKIAIIFPLTLNHLRKCQ